MTFPEKHSKPICGMIVNKYRDSLSSSGTNQTCAYAIPVQQYVLEKLISLKQSEQCLENQV